MTQREPIVIDAKPVEVGDGVVFETEEAPPRPAPPGFMTRVKWTALKLGLATVGVAVVLITLPIVLVVGLLALLFGKKRMRTNPMVHIRMFRRP